MSNTNGEHRPRRLLKYSAILLVAAQLAYATFLGFESWQEVKTEQAGMLATVADLDGNAIDSYFTRLEIGMRNLGAELTDTHKKIDLGHAYKLVHRFQELHTELGNVILMRGDGQVLLTGNAPNNTDMPTLASDPVFMEFRGELQRGPLFAIGRPLMGNIDKRWVTAARYAVTDRAGKIAYIISANLSADLLQPYWTDSSIPGVSALGLIRDDGYLVSGFSEPDTAGMDDLYGKPAGDAMIVYLRANGYPLSGQVEMSGSVGKATDWRALRRLRHYPLTLFVEAPMSEINTAWWARMRDTYFLMVLMLAGIVVFYGLSFRRRHVWSTAQRIEKLKHNHERVLDERNPNEILMFDADTLQITYASDYALAHTGYTLAQLQQKNILSLHPEMGIESFGAMIEPLRRDEQQAVKYRTVQARANGSTCPVEVNLQLMTTDGGDRSFMAIINDITALKQAEENIEKFHAPVDRRAAGRK